MLPLRSEPFDASPTRARLRTSAVSAGATPYDHPVALAAAVHEAVAGIQQALLWGLDVDDCRGLALDAFLDDVQMPVMDGPTCLRHIRTSDGAMREVPVIAVTANAMAGDRERYLAEGFTDYVSKPMTMQSLAAAIARSTAANRARA